jgi:hypothetical protein
MATQRTSFLTVFWATKRPGFGMNFACHQMHGIGGGTPIVD